MIFTSRKSHRWVSVTHSILHSPILFHFQGLFSLNDGKKEHPINFTGDLLLSLTKDNAVPKSFIFKSGKVTKNTAQLILDLRRVMEPNTATKLRERATNKLKDYMSVAGPLGVSHFMTFSQGEESLNLRMARFAGGPTCHFQVYLIPYIRMSWGCRRDQDLLDWKPFDLLPSLSSITLI